LTVNFGMDKHTLLGQEWQTLQNNHEQYEKSALLIKLSCIALCLAGLASRLPLAWTGFSVVLCWILEGIFKTYQGRLAERLLRVEALLGQAAAPSLPMQLHSEWSASRPSAAGLIASYAASAWRPTVTFPYLPILLMLGLGRWLAWL